MEVMNTEGYRFESEGFKARPERVSTSRIETTLLFEHDSEFGVQTLSRRVGSQEKGGYTSFGTRNEKRLVRSSGLGKTAQVATLATAELLASGTAVTAGGILAGGALHFPYTILVLGAPVVPGVMLPVTVSVIGIGLIVLGVKRIGAAARRVRSLF